jgi:hypothetical protein
MKVRGGGWLVAALACCWLSLGSCESGDCGGGCPGLFEGGGGSCAEPYSNAACRAIEQCGQGTGDGDTDPCIAALEKGCGTYDLVLDAFNGCNVDAEECQTADSGARGCHVNDGRLSCCVADAGASSCSNGLRDQIAIQQGQDPGR